MRKMRSQFAAIAFVALALAACSLGARASAVPNPGPPSPAAAQLNLETSDLALSGIDAETAAKYVEAAANDSWVIETLGLDRADPVEVVDFGDGKSGIAVFIYNYTASKALKVGFDGTETAIAQRSESSEQPSFSPREIAHAGELVAASDLVTEKSGGTKYRVWNVTAAHSGAFDGHRVLAVFLAPDGESADDLLIAYADLSVDGVVKVDDASSY